MEFLKIITDHILKYLDFLPFKEMFPEWCAVQFQICDASNLKKLLVSKLLN